MINSFIFLIAFVVSLFIYLHVSSYVKTSTKMEIYNLSFENKEILMDILKDKQPFVLKNLNQEYFSNAFHFFSLPLNFESIQKGEKDINVYNYQEFLDMNKDPSKICHEGKMDIDNYLKYSKDENFQYFSRNNEDKISKLGLETKMSSFDLYLKPEFYLRKKYDMWMGTKGMQTGLSFSLGSYYYILLKKGKAKVRCFLPNYNYKLFSKFNSNANVNVWDDENPISINKSSYIDVEINEGDVMHIPTYWSYSVYYEEPTILFTINYENVMSLLMSTPYKVVEYISRLNIEKKKVKETDILKPTPNICEPTTQTVEIKETEQVQVDKKSKDKDQYNSKTTVKRTELASKIKLKSENENENENVLNVKK